MSEQSLQLLGRIRARLNAAARRMTLASLLFGLVITAGICSGIWAILVAIEAGFWLETTPRTFLFWGVLVSSVALFVWYLLLPVLRLLGVLPGPGQKLIAHRVGLHFPQIGDRLTNLLDLSEGRRSESPDDLVDRAVQMLGRDVESVPIESVENFSRAKRAARFAAVPLLGMLLFLTAAPNTFVNASFRILSPGVRFEPPAPFRLHVEPGNVELARGSSLEIRVRAEGSALPETVVLSFNNQDEDHVEEIRLSPDSAGIFRHQLANVRRSFRYVVEADRVTSSWYHVSVSEHPMVRNLQVSLTPPSYSGIPVQKLDPNVGDVTGLPGTRVTVDLALGGSHASTAYLLFDDGSREPLALSDGGASGSFSLQREGSYRVILANDRGVENRDPIAYTMNLVADAPPSIVLLRPESDAILTEDLAERLESRINDDYGFRDLTLFYRLAESRFGDVSPSFDAVEIPISDPRALDQDVVYDWMIARVTDLDPVPGDVIEYYLRVRDNDAYAGYKAAETPLQRFRLPSLAEQYEQLHEEQDEVESRMENVLEQAESLDEQFRELRDEVRRKQDADWEDNRQLDQIRQQQENLERQVDQISQQVESMNESMQQNNLLSEETLQMYQEMQKVVEEINSPELMEALRQLQQSIEQLDLSQMQQSIENFEFNEEQYQQRLERALDLFKNLRAQQVLDEAARRAEELAAQQEQLAEQTARLQEEKAESSSENESLQDDSEAEQEPNESEGQDESENTDESENADESEGQDDSKNADESENPEDQTGREDQEKDQAGGENEQKDQSGGENQQKQSEQPQANDQQSEELQSPSESNKQEDGKDSSAPSPEDLAQEQELSREEMEQLEELLREAQKRVEEAQKGSSEEMEKLNQSVQQQQLPKQMQKNADQLRQNDLQDAQSGQQQMQQQLEQLQNQLSQMQSSMQGSQMQVNLSGLRRALSDVLTLSQQQENLRERLRNNVSEAPSLREDARRQVELSEGLSTVIDSLQKLAKDIPQMSREVQRRSGEALREMARATESMTERSVGQAAGHQKGSMMHLNELALLLSEVMNQMMNASGSGSGGGNMQQMIQQMQQMAQQQQKLNQQIQQFLNDVQGNRLNVDMQQRLQQMSAQQRAIQQQLEEIRRNPESRGKLLGDLEKISEQMEETIQELEQRQVDDRIVERQREILQRLLDAQHSIHQRGEEQKRESREGHDISRESPDDLPPEEAAEKLRRDLIRALETGYAPDYEELIKRYFELLQNQNVDSD